MPSRMEFEGVDMSAASFAKLPSRANMASPCFTEDLFADYIYDGTLGRWIPRGGKIPFLYDFATHGGAVGDISLGIVVPAGFVIFDGYYDVLTAVTGGAGATIALKANSAGDLLAAELLATAGTTGLHAIVPVGTAATAVKATAARTLTLTVAVNALTAGRVAGCLFGHQSLTA